MTAPTRIEQYARGQEMVAALGQRALESANPGGLMAEIVSGLTELLSIEFVEILRIAPDGRSLLPVAGVGWKKGHIGRAVVESGAHSQAGFTLLANEPVVVSDLRKERRFKAPALLLEHRVTSGVTVAIGGRLKPFGVLGVHSRQRREFGADDVHFLRTIANLLATAIRSDEADQAHRDSAARVQAIVNTLVDGVITIDDRGRVESMTPAAERIFGYAAAEVVGQNVSLLMPEPYRAEHDGYMQNYFRTGERGNRAIGP